MPKSYKKLALSELYFKLGELYKRYESFRARGFKLDMSRGKPSPEQLSLSDGLFSVIDEKNCFSSDGTDARNYGTLAGLGEAKRMFAELCGVDETQTLIGGNSSLEMMYDAVVCAMLFGVDEESPPWIKQGKIKFLCPSPGYDRHFAICQALDIEMIPVAMTDDGPDMNEVERFVALDRTVKGIWCVPKYSNPTGAVYSDETIQRFAAIDAAAGDFRIFWDNAYIVHDLYRPIGQKNIFSLIRGTKNENTVYEFVSTSKMTFPGAGVAAMISSQKNISYALKHLGVKTISYDKINQLRHALFFADSDSLYRHMRRHAELLTPKFELVLSVLSEELEGLNIAEWTIPKGGYFISLDVLPHTARKVWELCNDAGLKLTDAGATFPYGKDPFDRNLRIAPSYPKRDELKIAAEILCVCVKLAAAEKIIHDKEADNEDSSSCGRAESGKGRFALIRRHDRHRTFKARPYRRIRRRVSRDR